MPMIDIFGFGLLGGSAVAALACLIAARSNRGYRWIWLGISLTVFFLVTRQMAERLLPAIIDASAARRAIIDQTLVALAALAAAFAVDSAIRRFVWYGRLGEGDRSRVPNILIGLVSAGGYAFVCLIIAYAVFNLDVTAVAATSGVVAIVLGVSAQQTLGQVFAGLALNMSRPFRIGDSLQVDGVWGVVMDADWRAVTLRTYEGNLLTLPNTLIAASRLTNLSTPTLDLRHHIPFTVDIATPPGQVRNIALQAMAGVKDVLHAPAPMVLFKNFDERGVHYEAIFWHHDPNVYILRRDEVGQALWYAFHRAGIEIAVNRLLLSDQVQGTTADRNRHVDDIRLLRDFLMQSPICAGVGVDELQQLAESAHRQYFGAGERIMQEGESGQSMFVILEGRVSVRSATPNDAERELYVQDVGEVFGHMSAMTGAPRFATVRAIGHVTLAEFDKATLAPFVKAHPEIVDSVAREILRIEALIASLGTPKADGDAMAEHADHSHLLTRLADRIRAFFG